MHYSRLKGQHAGDENPTYAPVGHGPLYLTIGLH